MIHFVFFLLVSFLQFFQSEAIRSDLEQYPIFETTNGLIQGSKILSAEGNPFYAFKGIPFAKPPIGKLRFKMNDSTANLPVALFLYPGAYEMGDGSFPLLTSPWTLMDHDIIFVTSNFRLAVLGFLSTGDSASPGNYHLLDIILAMKWVKQNIQEYGGNPNRIILWGISSGATAVMHLLSSPLTKGLIQGVIAESGNSLTAGIFTKDSTITYKLAKKLRCPQNNTQEMIDCFRNKTAKEIQLTGMVKLEKLFFAFHGLTLPMRFLPTIDSAAGPEAIIPQHPLTLLQEAKFHRGVPILTGITRDESCLYYPWLRESIPDLRSKFKEKHFLILIKTIDDNRNTLESKNEIFRFYFKDTDFKNETDFQISLINLFSDAIYKSPHDLSVRLLSRYNPVYNYLLDYVLNKEDKVPCTPHVMEMFFILNPFLFPERMQKMIKQILIYWINFIKYGNPTPDGVVPKWEPVKPNISKLNYFRMSQEFSMFSGYRERQFRLWQKYLFNFTLIEAQTEGDNLLDTVRRNFNSLFTEQHMKQSLKNLIFVTLIIVFLFCIAMFFLCRKEKNSTD